MSSQNLDLEQLKEFLAKAAAATYAGGGKAIKNSERLGFRELIYEEGDWHYRDSFTGFYRSWGTELVRFKGKPVWNALYGGGIPGKENELTKTNFAFLKQALNSKPSNFHSFRGPAKLKNNDWLYTYEQEGGIKAFKGYEEIKYKGELVFYHHIIGGVIIERQT